MNIIDWMIKHKYAVNQFAANHIFEGLGLSKVPRFWMRVKLIILYRLHRDSGEPSKVAYKKALTLQRPLELFIETSAEIE
jgi:hypothetical protein